MKVSPSLVTARFALRRSEIGWIAAWLAVLVGLEVAGGGATSDVQDAVGVVVLLGMVLVTARFHLRAPLRSVSWLLSGVREIGGALRRLWLEFGVDLREDPPVPARLPRGPVALIAVLAGVVIVLGVFGSHLPAGLREFLAGRLYVAWVAVLAVLWCVTVGALLLLLGVPLMLIHDLWAGRFREGGSRTLRAELAMIAGYAALVVAAVGLLPEWVPLAGLTALLAVDLAIVWAPANPRLRVLWNARGERHTHSFDWRWLIVFELGALALGTMVLLLLTGVGLGGGDRWRTLPITASLGWLLGWIGLGGVAFLSAHYGFLLLLGRARNPQRRVRPAIRVEGDLKAGVRPRVEARLREQGWRVVAARERLREPVVSVRVDPHAPAGEPAFLDLRAPIDPATLFDPEVQWRLRRRHQIVQRRVLMRALEKLFKRAARRRFQQGTGFWVAPHLWFMLGLQRDADEEEPDFEEGGIMYQIIGPPYHVLLPLATRHHLYEIMQAVGVDLIFVEDGVGFRRLRNALRVVFEIYDVHGGRQRLEERHFAHVLGVRAVIHDLAPHEPFRSERYPEPDYEHIGRARILHLFRDRGEDEEHCESPADVDSRPVPVGV